MRCQTRTECNHKHGDSETDCKIDDEVAPLIRPSDGHRRGRRNLVQTAVDDQGGRDDTERRHVDDATCCER